MKNRKLRGKIVEVYGTASDFSTTVGVREELVSRVVCGRRTLSIAEQTRWATALNATLQELGFKRQSPTEAE